MRKVASSPPAGPAPDLEHWTGRSLADLAAECDAIREQRGLPDPILRCLLSDIAVAGRRADISSCSARFRNNLAVCGSCDWCLAAPQRAADQRARVRAWAHRQRENR